MHTISMDVKIYLSLERATTSRSTITSTAGRYCTCIALYYVYAARVDAVLLLILNVIGSPGAPRGNHCCDCLYVLWRSRPSPISKLQFWLALYYTWRRSIVLVSKLVWMGRPNIYKDDLVGGQATGASVSLHCIRLVRTDLYCNCLSFLCRYCSHTVPCGAFISYNIVGDGCTTTLTPFTTPSSRLPWSLLSLDTFRTRACWS